MATFFAEFMQQLLVATILGASPMLHSQVLGPPAPRFVRGDVSNDNVLSITDAVALLEHLFQGTSRVTCEDAADANDDGQLDLSDPVYMLLHMFWGGRPPPAPHPACGTDPSEDALGCLGYNGCAPLPEFTNAVGMAFVYIPPGTYLRGSPISERGRDLGILPELPRVIPDENQHTVHITCGFYMSATEVTQRQYQVVMGTNPTNGKWHPDRAVSWVTWKDAVSFCKKLTEREGLEVDGVVYRLPTEGEWEYACRAGTTTRYSFGDALECDDFGDPSCPTFNEQMWYGGHPEMTEPTPVGVKPPNPWGLHDMHGGVSEWVQDWYGPYPLDPKAELTDPSGPKSGDKKVVRGAASYLPHYGRSAARSAGRPDTARGINLGIRVVYAGCPSPPFTVVPQ